MQSQQIQSIPDEGKIDIHKRRSQFLRALEKLRTDELINPDNKQLLLNFIRECTLGKTVKGKGKKKIGPARCLKYIEILTKVSSWLDKSFDRITEKDMEEFVEALESDKFHSRFGRPYADETKADIKKSIKKFWKWKDGNCRIYPEIVEWIDTTVSQKEIPALSREEVEKLIEHSPSSRMKALIMVLFDSGARIEELLNVRLKNEHIHWNDHIGCYMIRLEFSKTKPRTISLPLSAKYLKEWLDSHPMKGNPQAQLFPMSYDNLRMALYRLAKKTLGKRVTPHILRHSSATFYANKLNHYQLCYRYGWTMSSDQVNCYIDRAGILEKETAGIITKSEIDKANIESRQLQEQVTQLREANEQLGQDMSSVMKELRLLKEGKGFMTLLMSLKQQQEKMAEVLKERFGKEFDLVIPRFAKTDYNA